MACNFIGAGACCPSRVLTLSGCTYLYFSFFLGEALRVHLQERDRMDLSRVLYPPHLVFALALCWRSGNILICQIIVGRKFVVIIDTYVPKGSKLYHICQIVTGLQLSSFATGPAAAKESKCFAVMNGPTCPKRSPGLECLMTGHRYHRSLHPSA